MSDVSSILETDAPVAGQGEVFVAPTSFFQRRLFTLDRLFPGQAAYNVPVALWVAGPLDAERLTAALAELTARHETLRTAFAAGDDEEPMQHIAEQLAPRVTRIDLGSFPAEGREAEAARLLAAQAAEPFDLARAPLLHTTIVRLGPDRSHLLLNLHHGVIDGWATDLLVRELFEIYSARAAGREPELPELALQYADFAAWQRAWLVGAALEQRLEPWRRRLADAPVALALPLDHPRPEIGSGRGGVLPFELPVAAVDRLAGLARAQGATLFMATLAAYAAFLSRITGQDDLVIGSPVSGRNRPELEGILGCIINTLPLRCRLTGDPGFGSLLAAVREVLVEALANQDLPLEKLVEELKPERTLAVNPLFQTLLSYEPATVHEHRIGNFVLGPLALHSGTAKVDLVLHIAADGAGMSGYWEWSSDLFDGVTIARFAAVFERLLAAAGERPEEPVSRLPLLAPAEAHQLLVEWNDTAAAIPRQSVPALYAEQAARAPDAVALAWDEGQLSYAGLDRQAGRIARRLRRLGVGPEARVGLVALRSAEMVAAVLGILKAGGAYVPLDPSFPRERLALLLADLAPAAVVGPRHLLADLPGTAPRLAWDDIDPAIDSDVDRATDPGSDPDIEPGNLAYVLYTSGSTGVPKGVEVTHAAVVRLVRQAGYMTFGPDEVFLQLVPMAFDVSTFELWGPLLNGGRLALYPPAPWAMAELAAVVLRQGVTTLWLTAGLFHLAAEAGFPGLSGLRRLVSGGDVLLPAAVERAAALLPGVELLNGYGPTENTTFSTTWSRRQGGREGGVPIGRPIGNSRAYVLDAQLAPQPLGVVGELAVGGRGVARGYLGRPELTAERFVPDPLAGEAGGRLYRTGDLARQTGDGTLEFLGRRDAQVKVRGVRVELGEVENALLGHAGVREGAVAAVGAGAGDRRLVAYYVPAAGAGADADPELAAELALYLRRLLPDALVPQAFVELAALPYLASGKVDRRALPAPSWDSAAAAPPRTPLEERLVALWEEILGTGGLSIHDDFFAAGGHSLLAARLTARIRRDLGVELPLRALFQWPTAAQLAAQLASETAAGELTGTPAGGAGPTAAGSPLRPVPRGGPLPMSAAQLRQWFLAELEPGTAAYNVPLTAELRGALRLPVLAGALAGIVRRQESLRTTFSATGGRPRPVIAAPGVPALPLVDLGALAPATRDGEVRRRVQQLGHHVFDLMRGPLLDLALFRLGPAEHLLFVDVHHIVFDGWSWGVFLRELAALYAAGAAGRPAALPELAIQYVDYAAWQQDWLAGEGGRRQGEFWQRQLAGTPGFLPLPTDRPRPAVQTYRGGEATLVLPPAGAAALRAFGAARGATLFMTLLAGFSVWLARATRQADVNVGTFVANRRWPEVEPLVGFFLNTLVLRGDTSGAPGAGDFLARVRDTALAAFENQDFPFERLLDDLGVERDPSRSPLFQVLLLVQNFAAPAIELPGLTIAPTEVFATERSHFDLSLVAGEEGGRLVIHALYNRHLFDPPTVQRFLGQLESLLAAMAAEPGRRIGELPWLAPAEHRQVVVEWADGGWPEEAAAVLPRPLLAAQSARTPDAVAVVAGERALSYGELEHRVGQVAAALADLGLGPESLVGITIPRSPEMVIGVLAVLEIGAGYLPLDPDLPPERYTQLLEDSRAAALLALGPLPAGAAGAAGFAGPVVRLDRLEKKEGAWPAGPPRRRFRSPAPGNLAYVIYTSGSTGRPKGVQCLHGALGQFIAAAIATYGITAADRVLQFASLSFDVSLEEIFPCLAAGGTLVLRDDAMLASPAHFLAACREMAITVLDLPTAYWHTLAAALPAGGPALPAALRLVIMGGERPLPERVAAWLETVGPWPRLWNTYGPTEATIMSTVCPLGEPGDAAVGEIVVPLGRPWGGSRIWLLDPALQPVPIGVAGEMGIAGGLLARGYLGLPEITAAAFVPSPFGPAGARLYRSGDLARHRPDGALEFLGRVDDQVKIRGFRVEPGEIAAVLARHKAVAQAVVVPRAAPGPTPGEVRLVAYYVAAAGEGDPGAGPLREFLRGQLPAYMVPADLVALAALPTTATGKVDFAALPVPAGGEGGAYAPPQTEVEELLVEIWQDVLSRDRIGIYDNLFDLGGHSLLIPRITARIEEELEVALPMRALFEAPTVAELAVVVEGALLAQLEGLSDDETARLLAEGEAHAE